MGRFADLGTGDLGCASQSRAAVVWVILQGFIDESITEGGAFVLGGYIANAESWVKFAKEWEEMLPHGTRDKDGRFHFKMAEMAMNADRMGRLPGFLRIIENHVLISLAVVIDLKELARAKARIWIPDANIDWGVLANPFKFAFMGLLDLLFTNRERMQFVIPADESVEFYFDQRSERSSIVAGWKSYLLNRPAGFVSYYKGTPRFEDDKEYLPLQAADFLGMVDQEMVRRR